MLISNTVSTQQTVSISDRKLHHKGGKTGNWNLLWLSTLWWEILPCLLPQRPKQRKEKSGASKRSDNENIKQTSVLVIYRASALESPNADSSCHSIIIRINTITILFYFFLKGESCFCLDLEQYQTALHHNVISSNERGLPHLWAQ